MIQLSRLIATCLLFQLLGCGYGNINLNHILVRSDYITSQEQADQILARAHKGWTSDGNIRVLYVQGTAYERGYQHGVLLRDQVRDNLLTLYRRARAKFLSEEIFAEAFERVRPYIPQEYIDEMHGLAHGAELPLHIIHHIHALPAITEWGGKKRIKRLVKQMVAGEKLGTSCSNIGAAATSTADGRLYAVRVLDWGLHRLSKLHEYPLITVARPSQGHAFANIGWVGFIGAVSGMNEQGITLGEMGYGDPPNETLRGKPMPFLLRDVLQYASNLGDVRRILSQSPGTNSFAFVMTDGKSSESEIYLKDRDRFEVFEAGEPLVDNRKSFPAFQNLVYGGHYDERMARVLGRHHGELSPELFMSSIIPEIAMKSNFQNVVYDPGKLVFWVNNANGPKNRAAEQPYTFFDLAQALVSF